MKRKIFILLGVMLLGSVVLSCAKLEDKATNSDNTAVAEVSGLVKDQTGNPIADVLVFVGNRSEHTYTDSKGEFILFLRPRSDTGFSWTQTIDLYFQRTTAATPVLRTLTIERGRTSVIRVIL